jgi:O-antigen/teichoic acid export membrane protein
VIVLAAVVAHPPSGVLSAQGEQLERPWASIWRIGAPAVLTQYNYAIGTVVLGVTGRAATAALAGVSIRLVSGLGGVQGALSTAIFPRLARRRHWQRTDATLAGLGLAVVVLLATVGLAVMVMIAPVISTVFLGRHDAASHAALIVGFAGGAGAGVSVQLAFILIAVGGERSILRASAAGAIVLTAGTAIAVAVPADHPAVVVVAAFTAGQAVTAVMLVRVCARRTASPRWALSLAGVSVVALPAAAVVASAVPGARAEVAVGLSIVAAGISRRAYVRPRRRGEVVADTASPQPQSRVAELVEP